MRACWLCSSRCTPRLAFFQLAAEQGHALAQFDLGQVYLNGVGTPKNLAMAKEWMMKAWKDPKVSGHPNSEKLYRKMLTAVTKIKQAKE